MCKKLQKFQVSYFYNTRTLTHHPLVLLCNCSAHLVSDEIDFKTQDLYIPVY